MDETFEGVTTDDLLLNLEYLQDEVDAAVRDKDRQGALEWFNEQAAVQLELIKRLHPFGIN